MPVSPVGRTQVQFARRVLRHASILTRQLAFRHSRNPMGAHGCHILGVPSSLCVGSSLPSVMFAAKSVPQRIRWHLATARGAVTRQFRFSRRDALNGRRLCRLCTVPSNSRLLMPASSPTSAHSGGIPLFPRHELPRQRSTSLSEGERVNAKLYHPPSLTDYRKQ